MRTVVTAVWIIALSGAQERPPETPAIADVFVCPMDKDVRAAKPGSCPRCGMRLTAHLPEHVDYHLKIAASPPVFRAGQPVDLVFRVEDPKTGKPVTGYEIVHEKLFHLFLISKDLSWFAHEHPEPQVDGSFHYRATFPKPAAYRLLADFFPTGGTPQFLARTLATSGATVAQIAGVPKLEADVSPKRAGNIEVELATEPPQPLAGRETLMFFRLRPGEGHEQYLGAWGHMLAASDDLVDMIHMHPRYVTDNPRTVQFNLIFPREAIYRVWVQFQRSGVVNTVAFTVPVKALR
jgi:hypothetical protein